MERVQILPNERVGIADYEAGAGGRLVQEDLSRIARVTILPAGKTTGAAATQARILDGFDWSGITLGVSTTATLSRGGGIFPYLDDDNTLLFGMVGGEEGPATRIVDFATASPSSTQAVYVRMVTTFSDFENRVFWNPSGAPAAEFVDNIATRKPVTWEVTFQAASVAPPGNGEWVKIYEITIGAGGTIDAVTDYRHFYYEGDPQATFGAYSVEWGDGANDRNIDRATYGVVDQHTWTQALRRQLSDIIGLNGWYKAPGVSLNDVRPLADRLITVDDPSGAGGDGTYTTLMAAIGAAASGDGGTILLKKGTYEITTMQETSVQINLLALEEGVIIENEVNAGNPMIRWNTGSEGSVVRGIYFKDGTLSSGYSLDIRADRIRIDQCQIEGEIRFQECKEVVWSNGTLNVVSSTTANGSDNAVAVIGPEMGLVVDNVYIQSGVGSGAGTRADTIYLASLQGSSPRRARVTFRDCSVSTEESGGDIPRAVYSANTEFDVSLERCYFGCETPVSGSKAFRLSDGRVSIQDCTIKLISSGQDFTDCLFSADMGLDADSWLRVNGLTIDFSDELTKGTTEQTMPMYLNGLDIEFQRLHVLNLRVPNEATAGSFVYSLIECNPQNGGQIRFLDSRFERLKNQGTGEIDHSILGQSTSLTGTGSLRIARCIFDGSATSYRSASSQSSLVQILGTATNIWFTDNLLFGGCWQDVVSLQGTGGIVCRGNEFLFSSVVSAGIDRMMICKATNVSEGVGGFISVSDNHLARADVNGTYSVDIQQGNRVAVMGNTDMNLTGSGTQGWRLLGSDPQKVTFLGNNLDDGWLDNSFSSLPATLASYNFNT